MEWHAFSRVSPFRIWHREREKRSHGWINLYMPSPFAIIEKCWTRCKWRYGANDYDAFHSPAEWIIHWWHLYTNLACDGQKKLCLHSKWLLFFHSLLLTLAAENYALLLRTLCIERAIPWRAEKTSCLWNCKINNSCHSPCRICRHFNHIQEQNAARRRVETEDEEEGKNGRDRVLPFEWIRCGARVVAHQPPSCHCHCHWLSVI